MVRSNGLAATSDQIASDYASVSRQQRGILAIHYRPFTSLNEVDAFIEDLLSADVAALETGVGARFAGYDEYPEPAQDALLEMAFNLGVAGLAGGYPHLKAAAEARDWAKCAAQCHRNGIGDDRNAQNRALFENVCKG